MVPAYTYAYISRLKYLTFDAIDNDYLGNSVTKICILIRVYFKSSAKLSPAIAITQMAVFGTKSAHSAVYISMDIDKKGMKRPI